MVEIKKHTLAIIGAGPSGITAAIYATRAGYKVDIYESSIPGGKVNYTATIENYPGFLSISGPELAMHFGQQLERENVQFLNEEVLEITRENDVFFLRLEDQKIGYHAVIVATGTKERELEATHIEKFMHRGVSYCAVCDGPLYKNKDVIVVGGGNAALEEAIFLSSFCHVTLIHRRDAWRADEILTQKLASLPITIYMHHRVVALYGEKQLEQVEIEDVNTKKRQLLTCSCVFPYIGAHANTTFLSSLHIVDEKGYVVADASCKTDIPGLFVAGDVRTKELRQIVTATSDGAEAGMNAAQYMRQNDF